MTWVFLSLLSAFGQALGWALKKRSLEGYSGLNNTLGFVSYLVAGVLLTLWWGFSTGWHIPPMDGRFAWSVFAIVLLNIAAVWTAYRAIDQGMFSFLMPFIAITAVLIVPIEYVLRGVSPNMVQIFGVILIVVGALMMTFRGFPQGVTVRSILYFSITVLCYAFSSVFGSIAIQSSGDGIYAAALYHLGIAFGFIWIALFSREHIALTQLRLNGPFLPVIASMIFAGIVIALLENGPSALALEEASASEVFALKRTMPLFALILGAILFKEKITRWHLLGIGLLTFGSVVVVWYK